MATVDLRCESKKHGEITDGHAIEIKCNSRFCGARQGVVILHLFNTLTGELITTQEYRDVRRGNV